jgi:hypothetical protein
VDSSLRDHQLDLGTEPRGTDSLLDKKANVFPVADRGRASRNGACLRGGSADAFASQYRRLSGVQPGIRAGAGTVRLGCGGKRSPDRPSCRIAPNTKNPPNPTPASVGGWGINFVGAIACRRNPRGSRLKMGGEVGAIPIGRYADAVGVVQRPVWGTTKLGGILSPGPRHPCRPCRRPPGHRSKVMPSSGPRGTPRTVAALDRRPSDGYCTSSYLYK